MLTSAQNKNLVNYIKNKIAKHEAVNRVEAAILRRRDKKFFWYVWGIVKLKCLVGETVCMSLSQCSSIAQVRKQDVSKSLDKLVSLDALERVVKGKRGTNRKKAIFFRKLV